MINDLLNIDGIIQKALEEDIGPGDITTDSIIDPHAKGIASLVSREKFILAGLPVFSMVFTLLDPDLEFEYMYHDGADVSSGDTICRISGRLAPMLKAERTALNFIQRMSGIATLTSEYVANSRPNRARILDTRKTVPGLRSLDKYSVRMGGGFNHRSGLFDGILIKDNHIAAAGSIKDAVSLARLNAPHTLKVEVETETLSQVQEALDSGADIILLDNMRIDILKQAVQMINRKVPVEVSGGVTLGNIREIAETGVDFISIGAITHSAKAVDLSLEIILKDKEQ
ncbi:MAG: carboxylating nicotinate-nucleotide diphosphorylase [Deltaproteobacteria bacterium]|nr:carboxylating nicotinate-nucleotide diphosphorylase [Deltaproteobacteria bacterium]